MIRGKKGQLGGLPNTVLIILFALIFLAVGFLFVQEILELDNLSDQFTTATDTNAWINSTGYTLDNAGAIAFNSPSITGIVNATNGATITLANATLSSKGIVTNATVTSWGNVNITYTYLYGEGPYLGVNKTISAFLEIPGLLGLLILVIMIAIIIAILFGLSPTGRVGTGA